MYYSRTVVTPRLGNTRPACSAGPKGSLRQPLSNGICSVATVVHWLVLLAIEHVVSGSIPELYFFNTPIIASMGHAFKNMKVNVSL